MRSVGLRELRQKTGEIVRKVAEQGETVEIRRHGRPIARLVPIRDAQAVVESASQNARFRSVWVDLDRIAEEISGKWPVGVSAEEAVGEDRE